MSISYLDPASLAFLNGIAQIQNRSQRAQQQLTTGVKINSIADSPEQVPLLAQTHAEVDHVTQINSNLSRVQGEVNTAESSLQSVVTLMERAQTLGTQGQTGFASADSRTQLAGELAGLLQQIVGVANTQVEGRYIFSGNSDQTTAYTYDPTQTNPISAYGGTTSSRQVEHPDGSLIPIAKTAQDLFDDPNPANSVFQSINSLRTALLNNDQAGIDAALPNLKTADSFLNNQITFYGIAQNRVADGVNYGATHLTDLKTRLGGIQDADVTQSIIDLTSASTQLTAALTARGKIPHTSLFDYLG